MAIKLTHTHFLTLVGAYKGPIVGKRVDVSSINLQDASLCPRALPVALSKGHMIVPHRRRSMQSQAQIRKSYRKESVTCPVDGCGRVMTRDSLTRHKKEIHMRQKRKKTQKRNFSKPLSQRAR
ncbi:hypothetical protein V8B97DRAFT_39521 [Scleroderma yunnanense]